MGDAMTWLAYPGGRVARVWRLRRKDRRRAVCREAAWLMMADGCGWHSRRQVPALAVLDSALATGRSTLLLSAFGVGPVGLWGSRRHLFGLSWEREGKQFRVAGVWVVAGGSWAGFRGWAMYRSVNNCYSQITKSRDRLGSRCPRERETNHWSWGMLKLVSSLLSMHALSMSSMLMSVNQDNITSSRYLV